MALFKDLLLSFEVCEKLGIKDSALRMALKRIKEVWELPKQ
jgi:hypothetical protein